MRDQREVGGAWATFQDHWKGEPAAALAPYVAHYWAVTWDLRGQPPYTQKIVPYPQVHLSFLNGEALVRGVSSGFVERELDGRGRVFGVAFRPGCFRPFLGRPIATITDRTLPAAGIFDGAAPPEPDRASVDAFLLKHLPAPDPAAEAATETAATLVERVAATPDLTRVDALAADAGLSIRKLQRLFAEHVGVAPKWVIRRYRLHEITERMAAGTTPDLARLAAELGYADQAHMSRDFRKLFGESITRYAERY